MLITFPFIILLVVIYFTLPSDAVKVYGEDKYYLNDYNNLINCVSRAKNIQQLKKCCLAIQQFERRNKHLTNYDVKHDVQELIRQIDNRYYILKNNLKATLN